MFVATRTGNHRLVLVAVDDGSITLHVLVDRNVHRACVDEKMFAVVCSNELFTPVTHIDVVQS